MFLSVYFVLLAVCAPGPSQFESLKALSHSETSTPVHPVMSYTPDPLCTNSTSGLPACNFDKTDCGYESSFAGALWKRVNGSPSTDPIKKDWQPLGKNKRGYYMYVEGGQAASLISSDLDDSVEAMCLEFHYATTGRAPKSLRIYFLGHEDDGAIWSSDNLNTNGTWESIHIQSFCIPADLWPQIVFEVPPGISDGAIALDYIKMTLSNEKCRSYPTDPTARYQTTTAKKATMTTTATQPTITTTTQPTITTTTTAKPTTTTTTTASPPTTTTTANPLTTTTTVSASSSPQNDQRVYFDVTDDVNIKVSPPTIYAGFTRNVDLTCSFDRKPESDFSTLNALILSKTESDPKQYRELATITSKAGVQQRTSLSATVSGHFSGTNGSSITLKWTYPGMKVKGRYVCEAHGLDDEGHPRISYANIDINVIEKGIGNEMVMQKMQEMESRLDVQSAMIGDLNKRLNQSKTSMIQYEASWRGHTYYLSYYVKTNTPISESFCSLYGGYLIEIDDKAEWDFVTNFTKTVLKGETGNIAILLGATNEGHTGKWTFFRSGKEFTQFHWDPSQPDGGQEHCMHLYNPHDIMGDHHCEGGVNRFMCEFDFSEL